MPKLQLVQDPDADALLDENPFALLVGMLLDQQVPMETAFAGPKKIADRMGGFDAGDIAEYDPDKFAALCSEKPAVHRFPGSMAKRIQALAQIIVDRYDGDAARLWTAGEPDGHELLRRLKGLPGFGEQKARIFLALLGKQYGVTLPGWREAAGRVRPAGHARVRRRHRRRAVAGASAFTQEADEGSCRWESEGKGRNMKTHLNCPCGEAIVGKDEDELVELTQAHLASAHPGMEYDRDAILFMAY